MSTESYDAAIRQAVRIHREKLAKQWGATVIFYYGVIAPPVVPVFRDFLEIERSKVSDHGDRLVVVLNTPGGSAETVERLVDIMRHHFKQLWFAVPEYAMSAGTIMCMAGDKIWMDYSSCLGPIDPQVPNKDGEYVPALGYLDQVQKLVKKSADNKLTRAEMAMLQALDLANLGLYEQARSLTVSLLQTWLANYKFANWEHHRTDPAKMGQPVTREEKQHRAEEIAAALSDNQRWHSHGRRININTLKSLRLEIDDYSEDASLREDLRGYHDLLVEHAWNRKLQFLLHGKSKEEA